MAPESLTIRAATPDDAPAIAAIFNQGISERVATFETREQTPERVAELIRRRKVTLAAAAADAGLYKLLGKAFTTNEPSIALLRESGWREVGVHRRHGRLDGAW